MKLAIHVVDAFANRPFSGNPAGVVVLDAEIEETLMQSIAMEMKHAETAFVLPAADGYNLRWFTPTTEVDLCGHATLASAHVLWSTGRLDPANEARFHTRSGLLVARKSGEAIEMDFPAEPATEIPVPPQAKAMFGSALLWSGRNRMDFLFEIDSERGVHDFTPDFDALASLGGRGVIVTASADDFVSRFFAPNAGVDEDPVTGSAHCCLGPYWSDRLGRQDLVGHQVSSRGGVVRVRTKGDRVDLVGTAVTVLEGWLHC